ncbi:hypothetical protein BaRGS_00029064 [Batillaria attramentaria]|uniref:Uncharacterized protein n=1 Tax=Batillaria attramentaria TaxID=370345 RepID=A0ABD0JXQ8_9CAEN
MSETDQLYRTRHFQQKQDKTGRWGGSLAVSLYERSICVGMANDNLSFPFITSNKTLTVKLIPWGFQYTRNCPVRRPTEIVQNAKCSVVRVDQVPGLQFVDK